MKALKTEQNKEDLKLIKGIFPKDMRTNEIKNKIYETKPKGKKTFESVTAPYKSRDLTFNTFKNEIFLVKAKKDKERSLD